MRCLKKKHKDLFKVHYVEVQCKLTEVLQLSRDVDSSERIANAKNSTVS